MVKKNLKAVPKKIKIQKEDRVIVISGKDKGKIGSVLQVDRKSGTVIVEGVNKIKKAVKKKKQDDQGGIIELEAPLNVSNVMIVTKNGTPTRVGYVFRDGKKLRIAKKTGEEL